MLQFSCNKKKHKHKYHFNHRTNNKVFWSVCHRTHTHKNPKHWSKKSDHQFSWLFLKFSTDAPQLIKLIFLIKSFNYKLSAFWNTTTTTINIKNLISKRRKKSKAIIFRFFCPNVCEIKCDREQMLCHCHSTSEPNQPGNCILATDFLLLLICPVQIRGPTLKWLCICETRKMEKEYLWMIPTPIYSKWHVNSTPINWNISIYSQTKEHKIPTSDEPTSTTTTIYL